MRTTSRLVIAATSLAATLSVVTFAHADETPPEAVLVTATASAGCDSVNMPFFSIIIQNDTGGAVNIDTTVETVGNSVEFGFAAATGNSTSSVPADADESSALHVFYDGNQIASANAEPCTAPDVDKSIDPLDPAVIITITTRCVGEVAQFALTIVNGSTDSVTLYLVSETGGVPLGIQPGETREVPWTDVSVGMMTLTIWTSLFQVDSIQVASATMPSCTTPTPPDTGAGSPDPLPTTTVPTTTAPTTTAPIVGPPNQLPSTGAASPVLAAIATVVFAGGLLLRRLGRRTA